MTTKAQIKQDLRVRPYHHGARARIKTVEGEYYGFEMEVDFPGKQMRHNTSVIPNANVAHSRYKLDAETDGSLMNSGAELITRRPLKVTEVRGKWIKSTLGRMVDEMGVKPGLQPEGYGLHVNVNMAGMHIAEAVAFLATLNFAMGQDDVQRNIMQRRNSYMGFAGAIENLLHCCATAQARNNAAWKNNPFEQLRAHFQYDLYNATMVSSRNNYAGMRQTRSPIAEVRGFHMSTDIKDFKTKADFVQKARRFANKNTDLMLTLISSSVTNCKNVAGEMSNAEKAGLLKAILKTPLNQKLNETAPMLSATNEEMIKTIAKLQKQREEAASLLFATDSNGFLRARQ